MTSEADDIYGGREHQQPRLEPRAQAMSGGIHIGFIQRLMEQATTSKYVKQQSPVLHSSFE